MTKAKSLIILFIALVMVLILPNVVDATTSVEYTRTIPSNEGTIKINFTGLELDPTKAYEFALVRQGGTPESWFSIDDGYAETTASVTLNAATTAIRDVLKETDTGFIYIREKDDATGTYVLAAYQVDLKLPYLKSLIYTLEDPAFVGPCYYCGNKLYNQIGGPGKTYISWIKVTDRDLVEAFLSIKNNSKDITELENSLPVPPTTYSQEHQATYSDKNDGLYLLWVKRTGENCKEVYSCIVHDGLPEATTVEQYIEGLDVEKPTVESIKVTSPESGTYKTGQTVKITVTFSEEITGDTVPTLKIKFGTSEERTVANGTISGKTIVYSYNIVDGDKGQFAVTEYAGGTIKDSAGNEAVIETKVVSGNTIKANVEGTTSNNTENQDKTEDKNEKDQTQATGKLPHAGIGIGLTLSIIVLISVSLIAYNKYNRLKGI